MCKAQHLANTAWAFATRGQQDEKLLAALVRAAERQAGEFKGFAALKDAWRLLATHGMRTDPEHSISGALVPAHTGLPML